MATTAPTRTLKNFINGEFTDAADGATEPVLNPATGEPVADMPLSTEVDVDRAVAAAKQAADGRVRPPGRGREAGRRRVGPHDPRGARARAAQAGRPHRGARRGAHTPRGRE